MNSNKHHYSHDSKTASPPIDAVYSSSDYVPGVLGIFAKLLTGFIIYLMSVSIQLVAFSPYMYIYEMVFILLISLFSLLVVWGTVILLKKRRNIAKLLIIFSFILLSSFISPYSISITIIILVLQSVTALIALSRMNVPEKIGLSPTLVIGSCVLFSILQIAFNTDNFKTTSAVEMRSIIMVLGITWIIISIFILNIITIKRLLNANKKLSKSLLYGNVAFSVAFAALILIISSVNTYKDIIINMLKKTILFIVLAFGYIMQMLTKTGADEMETMEITPAADVYSPSSFALFMEKLFTVLIIAILAFILFIILKRTFKMLINGIKLFLDYLSRNDTKTNQFEYSDIEESVFDKKKINQIMISGIKKLKHQFKRKPKLSDMKTNNEKIRLIYKLMLQKYENNGKIISKNTTAREMLSESSISSEKIAFLNGYEKARYSNHAISNEEVNAGIALLEGENM